MDKDQRKIWNENHKKFREILLSPEKHNEAIELFLSLHSFLHSSSISNLNVTLADELVSDLDEKVFRQYPVSNPDTRNSIAWHLWHITRIEDMTMNILVIDKQQVLHTANWLEKMNISFLHSGNDMSEEDIAVLSSKIDFNSLLEYREAVGNRTQEIISLVSPEQFKMKVEPNRIKRLFDENAVMSKSKWLAEYWSKKDIAGLILMPATRHILLHLNKCIRIKDKLHKKMRKLG
ncbi:DinB family protein [Radiobacillus deserti]|uniref:DinB family protein n=1 Tax=Radiobacillus deserti TaxID=2594883 RepID=A0A516KJK9_9BACI|nr:DinB family protein [Radiobacillus deserti]QDP41549.1 DinB family protein [Radiobacillus deserti]